MGKIRLCSANEFIVKAIQFTLPMSKASKSPRIQTFAQDKAAKESEYECVSTLVKAFQKEVQEPIAIRETLMKKSEMQRCMLHNIIFSVYCTVCRKILCASCMYTSTLHRKHRVVPIEAATDELREDLRNFQSKIPRILKSYDAITIANNEYLVKVERDISPVVGKLQQFYEGLRSFIKAKEKEQIAIIKQKRDEIRAEVNAFNKQINRVYQYIQEKCKSYANFDIKNELLVPSRNILQNLMVTSQFAKQPSFVNENTKFTIDPEKIKGVLDDITYKINQFIVIPVFPRTPIKSHSQNAVNTPRSVDIKSKTPVLISPRNKGQKIEKVAFNQNKKRVNSSIAGARTYRKT